jgi:RNA polymerase primary sigma factor
VINMPRKRALNIEDDNINKEEINDEEINDDVINDDVIDDEEIDAVEINSVESRISKENAHRIAQLVELGRSQGYVTLGDVMDVIPQSDIEADQFDFILTTLEQAGVSYVDSETESTVDTEEEEIEEEIEEELDEELDEEQVSDIAAVRPRANLSLIDADEDNMVRLYLKEAAQVPLLSREEEVELSKRIELGRAASQEMARVKVSSKRREELRKLIEDGTNARERLIVSNSRLVVSIAKKYIGRGMTFLDLVQEGNIGLMRAVKKFDYRRGFKFSTFATYWIRQAITRAIAYHGRTIRLPVHMGDKISRMYRTRQQLKQELGREPSDEELADALEITPDQVEQMAKASQRTVSLDTPTQTDDDRTLADFVEDDDSPTPEEVASQALLRRQLNDLLKTLPAREARLLAMRYGLLDGEVHSLQEIGERMGISRERVRQIESQAMRRLRKAGVRTHLRDELEG